MNASVMKSDSNYRFVSDPGHGWLEVPRSELERLGLCLGISRFSKENNGLVYLEEDCDMAYFMRAMNEHNQSFCMTHVYEEITPIRTYRAYKP